MAGSLVIAQLKHQPRLHPPGVVCSNSQRNGKPVHQTKIRIQARLRQAVGIGGEKIHGLLPPQAVQSDRQFRRKMVQAQKFNEPAHPCLLPEYPANFPGLGRRNAGHLCQALGLPLHHRQSLRPKRSTIRAASLGPIPFTVREER